MAFKGSNGVAVERRVDLASFFCMIGPHGPAVALAVFAMVSVLAGFVIYRTVSGRRRKKKASSGETERAEGKSDAAVTQAGREPPSALQPQTCATSTDVGDVSKDGDDPTGSHIQVRCRTAEKSLSTCASDVQASLNQHATSSHTQRVPSSLTEAKVYLEEPGLSLQNVVAEMQAEPATVCHLKTTVEAFKDEEISESSLKEPEAIRDPICQEVYNAEDQIVNTDADNSAKKTRREESAPPLSSKAMPFEQTLHMREDENQDETAAETGTVELNIEENAISVDERPKDGYEEMIHHQDGADPFTQAAEEEGKKPAIIEEEFDCNNTLALEATAAGLDGLNDTDVDFDAQSPQLDIPEIQTERGEEHSLINNQEMDLLPDECELIESCSEDDGSSSVTPMVDNDITSETTSQIDSVSDMLANAHQVEVPTVEDETENLSITDEGTTITDSEAPIDHLCAPYVFSFREDQQSVQELDIALKKAKVAIVPNPASDNEAPICKDMSGYNAGKSKTFEEPGLDSRSGDTFHEDVASSAEDQGNDPNIDDFSFVVTAPVMTEDTMTPPKLKICLPLFDPSELRDNNVCGGGEESGISSMAVSPEALDPGRNFDTVEIPAMDHQSQAEVKLEPHTCLLADDATLSVLEEAAPLPDEPCNQMIEFANVESLAANDMIGEGNKSETDQFTTPVRSDERERLANVKDVDEKVKHAGKKEAAMEEDEDFVKTEINIMEATMDHNEWITDGNPNFPWMNLPVPSFVGENHTATQRPPTDEGNTQMQCLDHFLESNKLLLDVTLKKT